MDITRTAELIQEGLSREVVNRIQNMRKQAGFDVSDRIMVGFTASEDLASALASFAERVRNETLAVELQATQRPEGDLVDSFEIESHTITIAVTRSRA